MPHSPDTSERFRRLFDDHYRALFQYCARRLTVAEANDAMADTFVVAWRKIGQVPLGAEARPWLFGVARNVVKNAHRSSRRRERLRVKAWSVSGLPPDEPEALVVRHAEDEMVVEVIATLSRSDQEILRLHTWEDLTASEIAVVLGVSPQAAHMRINRATTRFAKALTNAGYQPAVMRSTTEEGGAA